ncbi:MAG: hypothetical protein Kow00104_14540 [Rhodothalassiaceae bacterium]
MQLQGPDRVQVSGNNGGNKAVFPENDGLSLWTTAMVFARGGIGMKACPASWDDWQVA